MKNNIWTKKLFTGPRYGGGVTTTVGLLLITLWLISDESLLPLGVIFTVIGITLWFYAGYRSGKDTYGGDITPPSTKNTAANGNKPDNERYNRST